MSGKTRRFVFVDNTLEPSITKKPDVEHDVSEQHEHNDDQETDKFSIQFPIGGGMNVSGPNASKLWGKMGWAVIIGASAVAAAHFLRAVGDLLK